MYVRSLVGIAACLLLSLASAEAAVPQTHHPVPDAPDERLAAWPPRPRLAARQMTQRYGPPTEVTSQELTWRDVGPFTRIVVRRREVPHDFPRPHFDFLEHTVALRVPAGACADLLAFDGSLVIDRTAGELSARGDREGHNVLTLNLAHDIATGTITADAAREAFGRSVLDDALGRAPASATSLRFDPPSGPAGDPDVAVIRGSPVRPPTSRPTGEPANGGLGEILGFVVALDDNEILAAAEAERRLGTAPAIRAYAAMLHAEHGQDLVETLALGETVGVDPLETPAVDALRQAGAADVAALVPLEGEAFGDAFVGAMIESHTEALAMLDRFVDAVADGPLKERLIDARGHVLAHLGAGKDLRGASAMNAPVRRR